MQLTEKQIRNFFEKADKGKCWEWKGSLSKNGYGRVNINCKVYLAHRISAFISGLLDNPRSNKIGAIGEIVMHKCDNRKCINPKHLKVGTQLDNVRDARVKGRIFRGENSGQNNPMAKLKWEDVYKIRSKNLTVEEFKKKYNMNRSAYYNIKKFRNWIPVN